MNAGYGGFSQTAERELEAARATEARVLCDIERLGLQHNAWELDAKGYTVLAPHQAASPEFIAQLRDAIIRLSEQRHNVKADLATGLNRTGDRMAHGAGVATSGVLAEGRVLEQALMNERVLALITYLLGDSCQLSSMGAILKTQGSDYLEHHVDLVGTPSPFPPYAQVANATWLLTDYARESGCTCFVDGSHLKCRPPSAAEARDFASSTPIEAPAGSVLIWGGNVWHGSLPRSVPGLRVSLLCFFRRWYMYQAEPDLSKRVTQEMIDRNPPRFLKLLGIDPALHAIPEEERNVTYVRASLSQFG